MPFPGTVQLVQGPVRLFTGTNSSSTCTIRLLQHASSAFPRTISMTKDVVSPCVENRSMTKDGITRSLFNNSIFPYTFSAFLRGHRAFKDASTLRFGICRASVVECPRERRLVESPRARDHRCPLPRSILAPKPTEPWHTRRPQ